MTEPLIAQPEPGGVTGIVLAGGASRRMGRDKALLDLGGRPMISVVVDRLRQVADQVIVAADDVARYAPFADLAVPDRFPGVGTLAGIHSGLTAAKYDLALAVGCDMPCLDPAVLRWFLEAAEGHDVVVLRQGRWHEPLPGVYRVSCLPAIEEAIDAGNRRVISFFDRVRVRAVEPAEIAHLDPELRSFRNINSPADWESAQALFAG